ncbi:MAG: phosphoribosyltransferase domain-containing protein [Sulfurovum sp.]|nr:phosphoribosyltransferase domain-containing protein [Sulfurovum sp.]
MKITLKTGILEIESNETLKELVDYGSRINKKRGFLFVSKVLGKHLPTRPSTMQKTYQELSSLIPASDEPTLFIGFAETATALGQGVFEEANLPNSFYIHSTRFQTSQKIFFSFFEEHCHAPSHIFYTPKDIELRDMLSKITRVILIDDEVSTGNTANNLVKELKKVLPLAKEYYLLTILNWTSTTYENFEYLSLHKGTFNFIPKEMDFVSTVISEPKEVKNLDKIIPYNFGRYGVKKLDLDFSKYLKIEELKKLKVLVLGTAEFMYPPYLLAKYLEDNYIESYFQASTRSPVNIDGAITSKLYFKDNYFEEIDNFLYNVSDRVYDKVFLCYETTKLPQNFDLKKQLSKYFDVEEIFLMFSGSYLKEDVEFLVKIIDIEFTSVDTKEKLIQSGALHYSQMISPEYEPSPEYLEIFYKAFALNKERFAKDILTLSYNLSKKKDIVLVSLLRAGTPIGVLLKRTLKDIFDGEVNHYSISIIRDREIDELALKHILKHNPNSEFIFVDGWTGKGVINRELKYFIEKFNKKNNSNISDNLYVISDIASVSDFSVNNDDYLIPSSALNSTISGLVIS